MFVARKSDHIKSDIDRNWSSWNFGQEGFTGSRSQLDELLKSATDTNPVWISGFEIYPDDVRKFTFGELYSGYWVAIDTRAAGLSCLYLESETEQEAIEEALALDGQFWGDGQRFDAKNARLVQSINDIHIFEINK